MFIVLLFLLVIARQTYILAQTTNDLSVTATVPAQALDFQATVSSSTTGEPFAQDTTVDYQINYGSNLSSVSTFTLEAQWDQGTLENASVPTVNAVNYVVGSATDGYGVVPAVIDTVNNKITWNFVDFPAVSINKTVSFQLKTTDSYKGSSLVNFPVAVRIIGSDVTTADNVVTKSYKYVVAATPTPTNTPTPTTTPAPTTTSSSATPTPTSAPTATPTSVPLTPTPTSLSIDRVFVREISQSKVNVNIETSAKTKLTYYYGTTTKNLDQRILTPSFQSKNEIVVDGLNPVTTYYFRIIVTDETGRSARSDIFTFTTAQISDKPQIDPNSIVFVSNNVVLNSKNIKNVNFPFIVIPQSIAYTFNFSLEKGQLVKKIQAIVRNKNVLGIKDVSAAEPNTELIELFPLNNNTYEGRLNSPNLPGYYELFVRIEDINGNILEPKISEIRVSKRMTVLANDTNAPIESAKIMLYAYNENSNTYQFVSPQQIPIVNPDYTDFKGQIKYTLFTGRFKARVSALGYKDKDVLFTLGVQGDETFPTIILEKMPFNLVTLTNHYYTTFLDTVTTLRASFQSVAESNRFFELNALIVILLLVVLTLMAFSSRLHIPLQMMPSYFKNILHRGLFVKPTTTKISRYLINKKTGQPLTKVRVFLIEAGTKRVVDQTTTDSNGQLLFSVLPLRPYFLELMIKGMEPITISDLHLPDQGDDSEILRINLSAFVPDFRTELAFLFEKSIEISFEIFLMMSIVFELFFAYVFEWQKVFPFVVISLINLSLWVFHEANFRPAQRVV